MTNSSKSILSIGNFDGVHLGHQKLISEVSRLAQVSCIKSIIVTLDPHPIKLLFPERSFKSILLLNDKVNFLRQFGADEVEILQFSRDVSNLEPEEFFVKYVVNKYNSEHFVVGYDFNFGKNRQGTLEVAKKLCDKFKIKFLVVEALKINDEVVSSSAIRAQVSQGQVQKAAQFLGRSFYLTGMIEKGVGRGKKIGFPTANLFTKNELYPLNGVYITLTEWADKKIKSVTNVGSNPTFTKAGAIKVETHFLDFNQDIYGEKIKVNFLKELEMR
ncbi:MAG: bifunctional riboflavin kinase/FAD synthetase [Oligoflexia bacterium]|nr:bifunctional riboflavin kinase/FAD synthetase [Oligoflexia bacterium]